MAGESGQRTVSELGHMFYVSLANLGYPGAWLFGSGLLGLIGVARRKKPA